MWIEAFSAVLDIPNRPLRPRESETFVPNVVVKPEESAVIIQVLKDTVKTNSAEKETSLSPSGKRRFHHRSETPHLIRLSENLPVDREIRQFPNPIIPAIESITVQENGNSLLYQKTTAIFQGKIIIIESPVRCQHKSVQSKDVKRVCNTATTSYNPYCSSEAKAKTPEINPPLIPRPFPVMHSGGEQKVCGKPARIERTQVEPKGTAEPREDSGAVKKHNESVTMIEERKNRHTKFCRI